MEIFGTHLVSLWQCRGCFGCLCCNLCNKSCFDVYKAGNGHGNRFQKMEQRYDEWAAHGQPTSSVLGLLKTVPSLCEMDQKRPCVGCLKLMKRMA